MAGSDFSHYEDIVARVGKLEEWRYSVQTDIDALSVKHSSVNEMTDRLVDATKRLRRSVIKIEDQIEKQRIGDEETKEKLDAALKQIKQNSELAELGVGYAKSNGIVGHSNTTAIRDLEDKVSTYTRDVSRNHQEIMLVLQAGGVVGSWMSRLGASITRRKAAIIAFIATAGGIVASWKTFFSGGGH